MFRVFLRGWCYAAVLSLTVGWINVQGSGSTALAQAQSCDPQQVNDFLANPGAILTQNPGGGSKLVSQVAALVQCDPSTLNALIGLLATANNPQQSAIGAGLGQAALALVTT